MPAPRDANVDDDDLDDPSERDDGSRPRPSIDDESELPSDPYAELRADPDLPPEVLAENIEQDDRYIAALGAGLREHLGLKSRQ